MLLAHKNSFKTNNNTNVYKRTKTTVWGKKVDALITINSDLTPSATPTRKTERKGRNEGTLS